MWCNVFGGPNEENEDPKHQHQRRCQGCKCWVEPDDRSMTRQGTASSSRSTASCSALTKPFGPLAVYCHELGAVMLYSDVIFFLTWYTYLDYAYEMSWAWGKPHFSFWYAETEYEVLLVFDEPAVAHWVAGGGCYANDILNDTLWYFGIENPKFCRELRFWEESQHKIVKTSMTPCSSQAFQQILRCSSCPIPDGYHVETGAVGAQHSAWHGECRVGAGNHPDSTGHPQFSVISHAELEDSCSLLVVIVRLRSLVENCLPGLPGLPHTLKRLHLLHLLVSRMLWIGWATRTCTSQPQFWSRCGETFTEGGHSWPVHSWPVAAISFVHGHIEVRMMRAPRPPFYRIFMASSSIFSP